ncbi:hypothetical protein [uncultured Psychroserpens sp.]|uniref:hypothetical protein n=1 Tax=uncultured Psychroserpens sp. TaxID=255436 RepID=UPI00260A18CF|nr:hypothetical protein [uncultured Psychroserpens sp.]
MNSRWYISILIITLTLLGSIASNDQTSVPNQEIVLQFTSSSITSQDTQHAIALVKQKLQTADVKDIKVQEQLNGQLKISYYSSSDVSIIKALLSEDDNLSIDYVSKEDNQNKVPSEDKTITYNVDVYEILKGDDASSLDGKLALETKAENDRFSNPNSFLSTKNIDDRALSRIVKVAYRFNKNIAIAIDNRSRKIPEVRAGPTTNVSDLLS